MNQVLAESNEARGFAMRLKNIGVASEIVNDMKNHASWMGKAFDILQKLVQKEANHEQIYKPIFEKLDEKQTWYTLRKGAAKGIEGAIKKRGGDGSSSSASKRRQKTAKVDDAGTEATAEST